MSFFNDPPESPYLKAFAADRELTLVNALAHPKETRSLPGSPASTAWTHRYKPAGHPARYELFDQIWLSQALADKQKDARIDRRQKLTGDGSDHDPAWISLNI